jgi:hypothetical protein
VLLALLLGLGAWQLLGNDGNGSQSPQTSASAGTSASGEAFLFDPQNYIGEDYRQVQAELEAENLSVTAEPATADQLVAVGVALDANAVAATEPDTAGPLEPGSDVVLYYAETAYTPDDGVEPEPPASTSATPTSTSATPTSTSATPTSTSATPTSTSATPTSATSSAPASSLSSPPTEPTETSVAEGAGPADGDSQ